MSGIRCVWMAENTDTRGIETRDIWKLRGMALSIFLCAPAYLLRRRTCPKISLCPAATINRRPRRHDIGFAVP